jgi:hypothetical protein
MILTRDVSIRINENNYLYYEELGYDVSIGEKLNIPIELLSTGSHQKIDCQCDNCGTVKTVIFKNYIKYGNKWGEYFCRKCSEHKRKRTLNLNYGVDYPIQNKEIRKKIYRTMMDKWGVDNPSKSEDILSKKKK